MRTFNLLLTITIFWCISLISASDINTYSLNQEGAEYLAFADTMPELIGGVSAFNKAVKYPQAAKDKGITGKVYILAFINEKGIVDEAKVIMGIGSGCDEAAIEAVMNAKFEPAEHKGENVKVKYSIPVEFL